MINREDNGFRLLNVRSSDFGYFPSAADARSAIVSDNQSQSLKRFKFLQDGSPPGPYLASTARSIRLYARDVASCMPPIPWAAAHRANDRARHVRHHRIGSLLQVTSRVSVRHTI